MHTTYWYKLEKQRTNRSVIKGLINWAKGICILSILFNRELNNMKQAYQQ